MIRYRLALTIRYRFARPTAGPSREILRIRPADLPGRQRVAACSVTVEPRPAERVEFADFYGTRALALVLPAGLSDLAVTLSAEVECRDPGSALDLSPPLAGLAAELAGQTTLDATSPHHFLAPSRRVPALPDIAEFATAAVAEAEAPTTRATVEAVGRALHRAMRFDAGATTVDTPIGDAFAHRHGVCLDFAQIMIGALRSLAAYVSGYLRTRPPPGRPRLAGANAMHAWVRAWCGARAGWVDYDPTNAVFASADHVVIGHGRDYADVAPVIGALRLDGAQSGDHVVDLDVI